jgi:penicillin-binding protein 1A
MLRALIANLRAGKTVQGGSTITQQVVKNLALDAERSYRRKIRETILARRVEQNLTKDEIFSLYLNQIYFGHGRYGIEEAARYYFGKRTKELSLAEAALLAGLVAAPERYSPRHSPERALGRRHYVLNQMLAKRFVTEALFRRANEAPLRLAPAVELEAELSPEIVTYSQKVLRELVGKRARRGGYAVSTAIDPALQALARRAVRANLDRYAKRQKLLPPFTLKHRKLWGRRFEGKPERFKIYVGTVVGTDDRLGTIEVKVGDVTTRVSLNQEERYNPRRLPPSEFTRVGAALRVAILEAPPEGEGPPPARLELGPQSALVAIDVRTREVRALIGSYEALAGGLDRATRARRQPGSAFKPFVYGYALHSRRFAPATVLELADSKAPDGVRRISVREALARSDNAAAEYLLQASGAANVVQWARAAGIESKLAPTRSLALGAYEVTPLEITNAYATFASGGSYAPPKLISKIASSDGREVPLPPRPPARRVMDPDEAYLVTSLLRGVVESGTGRRARSVGRPVAGKTGTTNQAKDAWFVGYSTELVVGVWVGYDDALPLGWGEQGAVTALPAWIEFMKGAHENRPATAFSRPSSVLLAKVDPATGELPYEGQEDSVEEEFLRGTVPTETAEPDAGADAGLDADAEAGPEEDAAAAAGVGQTDGGAEPASPVDSGSPPDPGTGQPRVVEPDEPPPF